MRYTFVVLFAVLALALPMSAQTQVNEVLFPSLQFTLGGYNGHFDTELRLNPHSADGSGTEINFEKDLGNDGSKSMGRFEVGWRPFTHHEFTFSFFRANRSSTRVIDREINWGDETYPVNATLDSKFKVDFWDLNYTYWALQSERNGLGYNFGIAGLSIGTELGIVTAGSSTLQKEQRASTDLPVPVLGLEGRHAFNDRFLVNARLAFLPKVSLGDYEARASVGKVGVEYRFLKVMGVGAEYNYFNIQGSVEKDRFNGDVGLTVKGPEILIRAVF